jgi:2-oxoglutarate ferredoxin oxidoreductase subunit alpha
MAAVDMARERGMRVGFFRPVIIWPFPDGEVLKVAEKVKTILVCELNIDGQLSREVARASRGKAEVFHLGSGGVEPHLPMQVFNEIRRLYP